MFLNNNLLLSNHFAADVPKGGCSSILEIAVLIEVFNHLFPSFKIQDSFLKSVHQN